MNIIMPQLLQLNYFLVSRAAGVVLSVSSVPVGVSHTEAGPVSAAFFRPAGWFLCLLGGRGL